MDIKCYEDNKKMSTIDSRHSNYSDEEFYLDVKSLANKPEDFLFTNDDKIRSQITSSEIFRTTKKELFLYSYGFRDNIDPNVDKYKFYENLHQALNRLKSVKILIDEKCKTNVFELVSSMAQSNSNVELRITTKEVKERIAEIFKEYKSALPLGDDPVFHFTIGDKDKYRIEYDKDSKKAFINFKDNDTVLQLRYIFQSVFDNSTVLSAEDALI